MVNQVLIATNMIGVCEALLYGYKAGLDLPTVLQIGGSGAAGSWSLNNLGPRIIARQLRSGFFRRAFHQRYGDRPGRGRRMGLALPGLALAHQLYVAVKAQGYGRLGTHALELALAQALRSQLEGRSTIMGSDERERFAGLTVALVTPFKSGAIDEAALRQLVEFQVEAGTDCVCPVGTTGEVPTLSHDEHERVIADVCELAAGRIKVMPGTGSNSTREAMRLTK